MKDTDATIVTLDGRMLIRNIRHASGAFIAIFISNSAHLVARHLEIYILRTPFSRIPIDVHKSCNSDNMCELIIIVFPSSRAANSIRRISDRDIGSSPESGSSSSRSGGLCIIVFANTSRCFIPRDNSEIIAVRFPSRFTRFSKSPLFPAARRRPSRRPVRNTSKTPPPSRNRTMRRNPA